MRVLIAMETSGQLRRRFRALGHDCWSCDRLDADDAGDHHIIGDVFAQLWRPWDMLIAHPDCTYLTNSAAWAFGDGPYHQAVKPGTLVGAARRDARELALADVWRLMAANIPRIVIENPIGAISTHIRIPDQIIQPHQFGDDASKATCLWLRGLPPLVIPHKDDWYPPRMVNGKPRWGNQTDSGQNRLSPGPDRWRERSRTYQGIADAMADQWGGCP